MYIKIGKNPDGSHAYQLGGNLEDGWAAVPDGMELPETFPYVEIETELVTHPAVMAKDSEGNDIVLIPEVTQMEVTTMLEGEEIPLPEEPEAQTLESRVETLEADSADTKEALEMILSGVTE